MTTRARDFKFAAKIVVGNGGLNSKSVVSALCLVLSWKVTYYYHSDRETLSPYQIYVHCILYLAVGGAEVAGLAS